MQDIIVGATYKATKIFFLLEGIHHYEARTRVLITDAQGKQKEQRHLRKFSVEVRTLDENKRELMFRTREIKSVLPGVLAKAQSLIDRTTSIYKTVIAEVDIKMNHLNIKNQEEILKKWEWLKPNLLEDYKGKEAEHYIRNWEKKINSEESIKKDLLSYYRYGLLCKTGLYGALDNNKPKEGSCKYKHWDIREKYFLEEITPDNYGYVAVHGVPVSNQGDYNIGKEKSLNNGVQYYEGQWEIRLRDGKVTRAYVAIEKQDTIGKKNIVYKIAETAG